MTVSYVVVVCAADDAMHAHRPSQMLASKLYDRLGKTGCLTAENKDIAKKLPHCKTKEELRLVVRDLLQMFKRRPPAVGESGFAPLGGWWRRGAVPWQAEWMACERGFQHS
jgi:hypothetical protein